MQPYYIVIQVRLPTNITEYRASDLTGTVTGTNLYKHIKFPTTYEVPIKDGAVHNYGRRNRQKPLCFPVTELFP